MDCTICGNSPVIAYDEYSRCGVCGVIRTSYDYDSCLYGALYSTNYKAYAQTPTNLPLNLCRLGLASRWMTAKDASLLDVGCCIAEFIRFAEKYYFCVGYEPNESAVAYAKQRVRSLILKEVPENRYIFDVITMFDVIEHIQEPSLLLKRLDKLLKPGGVVIVTTPNALAAPDDSTLKQWKHYKPKEHLWLHTIASLVRLFEPLHMTMIYRGIEESDIRPGNPSQDILTFVARKDMPRAVTRLF